MKNTEISILLKQLSERPVAYQKIYTKVVGSICGGLLLSQIIYWWYIVEEKEFYKKDEEFCKELGMTFGEFRTAKSKIKETQVINTQIKGVPAKTYYKVNTTKLIEAILVCTQTQTSMHSDADPVTESTSESILRDGKDLMSEDETSDVSTSSSNKTFDKNSYPYLLSELLLHLIHGNKPNFYEAKLKPKEGRERWLQRWSYDLDLMIRVDKLSPERIEKVITWCQADDFWKKNILSTTKLRQQFQNLEIKMVTLGLPPTQKTDTNPDITTMLIDGYRSTILQTPSFMPTDKDMNNFIAAAERVVVFADNTNISKAHVIDHLFSCIEMQYTDKNEPVFPGHFSSKNTWEKLMPQYLRELGVTWNS